MNRICPICNNPSPVRLQKSGLDYHQCISCKHIFSDPIDQTGLVGGQHHEGRNLTQNHIRIDRMDTMTAGIKKEDVHILDFGCGFGWLVKDFKYAGYNAVGYDAYNDEFSRLPEKNKFHVCVCVECIEHCSHPFVELDVINRSLVMGGLLYFETGFWDVAIRDKVEIQDYIYISPEAGHSSIFSHHSMDLLLCQHGFAPKRHFDDNCRLYVKIKDTK